MMCPWDISRGFRGFLLLAAAFWTTALVLADVRGLTETLRKYPPLGFLNRECTKDYTFPNSDITVRKGDAVVLSPYGLQRDADIYPDPETFDPDRFAEDSAKVNPYTFLSFGEGPRICIGYRFGLIQAKFTVATMLKHFRFTFNNKTKMPFELAKNAFALSVDGGIWLNAEKI